MFASTAIGVSHLVQSTRSGAKYGWANTWAICASNLFKYPFFEFSSRYANVTGTSLVDGYCSLGRCAIMLLTIFEVASCPVITAAVALTTGAFIDNLLSLGEDGMFGPGSTVAVLYLVCSLVLLSGRFSMLDRITKAITVLLTVCTLAALGAALVAAPRTPRAVASTAANGSAAPVDAEAPAAVEAAVEADPWDEDGIRFLVALMGWMPIPVDTGSIASSLWAVERCVRLIATDCH